MLLLVNYNIWVHFCEDVPTYCTVHAYDKTSKNPHLAKRTQDAEDSRAVDPDSFNPDPNTDPDPAFQVNPDPDPGV
jgi:hypothetical protein